MSLLKCADRGMENDVPTARLEMFVNLNCSGFRIDNCSANRVFFGCHAKIADMKEIVSLDVVTTSN